ncbi:Tetratricopeptide repeat-containing protein [Alteromonadaceae bacterium Bs31]|nr:Tetratricopeptide repeat-containing protein [Alteromonadaceae bacterium Bs31]
MKLVTVKSIRSVGVGALLGVLLSIALPTAQAQAATGCEVVKTGAVGKPSEKRALPGISEAFFKKLGKVADLASPPEDKNGKAPEPDFRGALKELQKIEKGCSKCNQYEMAQIYNYYGWIYYSLEDYSKSVQNYKKVVQQSPMIPWGLELQTIYTLAQLEFSQERYKESVALLNKWMGLSNTVGASVYNLKSSICYQMDDKKGSLAHINIAVKMIEEKGQVAKEPWYSLQRALYLEKEDYRSALPILVKMVRHYPKESYLQQLAAIYGMLEQEKKQLGVLDATYLSDGLDKEQQLLNLSYLMIQNEYPYYAAKVLEKGMKDKVVKRSERNLETLAKAWGQSQEKKKAIPVMAEAASMSDTGDLYVLLLGLYLDIDNNKKAIEAGKKALKKGKLKRPGELHLNMGVAYVELKNYESAIKAFEKAKEYKRTKKFAESWLQHAKQELYRQEQLAQG